MTSASSRSIRSSKRLSTGKPQPWRAIQYQKRIARRERLGGGYGCFVGSHPPSAIPHVRAGPLDVHSWSGVPRLPTGARGSGRSDGRSGEPEPLAIPETPCRPGVLPPSGLQLRAVRSSPVEHFVRTVPPWAMVARTVPEGKPSLMVDGLATPDLSPSRPSDIGTEGAGGGATGAGGEW